MITSSFHSYVRSSHSIHIDEQDLSGVVLSCFDRNDFILEALSDSQPDSNCDPTCVLQCFPASFKLV